jgi:Outer membrane protein beta-barrel domain
MKRSIFYFAILGLLLLCFGADAQDVAIGIRGGISIPNLSAGGSEQNPLNTGYSSRQGPDVGLYAEFKFSDLFSLQPMIQYSSQGGKKNGMQAFPTPDAIKQQYQQEGQTAPTYLYAKFNSDAKLNYLMIPVLAKFGWNFHKSPLRIYVDAGPFVGFLLSAKQVTSGTSNFYADAAGTQQVTPSPQNLDNTQDIKVQLNKTNFGIEGNLGLQYKLKQSYVFIEGGGNYGFLNIQKGTANGKNNTGAATIDVGYALWFGK